MGFWGTYVVHRGEPLLVDLLPDVVASAEAELRCDGVSGHWQVSQVFRSRESLPAAFLTDLREATDAPVLAAHVLDSDAALVTGLGRRRSWQAWLHLDSALGYLAPPPAPFAEDGTFLGVDWTDPEQERQADAVERQVLAETLVGPAAAAAAIAWAQEAGLRPGTVAAVTEVLDGHEVFVEDLFFALLNQLGLGTDDVDVSVDGYSFPGPGGTPPARLVDASDGQDAIRANPWLGG